MCENTWKMIHCYTKTGLKMDYCLMDTFSVSIEGFSGHVCYMTDPKKLYEAIKKEKLELYTTIEFSKKEFNKRVQLLNS